MTSKYIRLLVLQLRRIWVRVVSFALLAVATIFVSQWVGAYFPLDLSSRLGADSVEDVLSILASSMLAVTTFSLSIAVSAFAAAAGSATPRATALLQEDNTTQNVLATFLGAFLFGLVGIIALKSGYYGDSGRLVLFVVTVFVIFLVILALLRWISHLMVFGRIEDTLDRVERAAERAMKRRIEKPWLGGQPPDYKRPDAAIPVPAGLTGYVQHIDMGALSNCAEKADAHIWLGVLPGDFVHPKTSLLDIDATAPQDEDFMLRLRTAFTFGTTRSFDQDPQFGLTVLSEIASRALSPAVNDPGTAIDVLGRMVRVLNNWQHKVDPVVDAPRVIVPSLTELSLLEAGFRPIARDGASVIEVQMALQQALLALKTCLPEAFGKAAGAVSREAIQQAETRGGLIETEMAQLRDIAAKVQSN